MAGLTLKRLEDVKKGPMQAQRDSNIYETFFHWAECRQCGQQFEYDKKDLAP